jgi:hypothetical protein
MSKYLDKTLGLTFGSFYTFIVATLLHNFISGLLGKEEPFFFTLAMAAALVFPLALVFSSITWVVKKRQKK